MLKPMKDNGTIRFYDEVNFVYYELGINNEPINIGDTKKRPALRKCVAGDASIRRILICRTYADKSPYEGHHKCIRIRIETDSTSGDTPVTRY